MTLYRDDTEDGIPQVTFIDGNEYRRVVPVEADYEVIADELGKTFTVFAEHSATAMAALKKAIALGVGEETP